MFAGINAIDSSLSFGLESNTAYDVVGLPHFRYAVALAIFLHFVKSLSSKNFHTLTANIYTRTLFNQSIKTHFYSAICRERIRGA